MSVKRCENPFSGLADPLDDNRLPRDICTMFFPMAGKNIYASSSCPSGKLNIMRMVSDHKGTLKVYVKFTFCFFQKIRIGFDTLATGGTLVRTNIRCRNRNAFRCNILLHKIIHILNVLEGNRTFIYARLIRHNKQIKVISQATKCRNRILEEHHLRGDGKIPTILNNCPVTVKEDGGAQILLSHACSV